MGSTRLYTKATEELIIQVLGHSKLTTSQVVDLTGCGHTSVSYLLASMFRKGILDRDPENYRPLHYWRKSKDPPSPNPELEKATIDEIQYLINQRNRINERIAWLRNGRIKVLTK